MNIALVLSGGSGVRMGTDIPKQYIEAGGKPVISYCLETLSKHEMIDAIQIVADEKWQSFILESMGRETYTPGKVFVKKTETEKARGLFLKKFRGFSSPGENRQLSIFNGLTNIRGYAESDDLILIHDAARPMLAFCQISEIFKAAEGHDGVMPVLAMKDTVYFSVDGNRVSELLDRRKIFAGQAPEAFRLEAYYKANMALLPKEILGINGSTEPAIMAGLDVVMIPGDDGNFKITTMNDFGRFRKMIENAEIGNGGDERL